MSIDATSPAGASNSAGDVAPSPYTDEEMDNFYKSYSLASGVEIPNMQTAQAPSSNDSCMGDILSILKVVLPVVAPLM